jgi:hypothetical protein
MNEPIILPNDIALIQDPRNIRDLAPAALEAPGRPRIMPASFYRDTSTVERALFGQRHGIYGLPTAELVDWLRAVIDGRRAIEIGAGHGALAAALGIPATDNKMQVDPLIAQVYAASGQPTVIYGQNIETLDAAAAIAHHRPQVVIACWVTHKYDETRHEAGGNMFGVDEDALLDQCDTYIFIGNTHVHRNKAIWKREHIKIEPDWLYSRAVNGSPEFIAVWERNRK